QCLVKALSDDIDQGAYQHDCHPMMVRQNKWRACRFGHEAELVDTYSYEVRSLPQTVQRLASRLRPTAESLDCVDYLDQCVASAAGPSWADRQTAILAETGDPAEIVRQLTDESRIRPALAAESE
ncbi:MAG: glutamate--cysteine ligase, partial [Pirellulales bacterium]|nr:glutamate--cysteine ligase [Pirellulales bacterium]